MQHISLFRRLTFWLFEALLLKLLQRLLLQLVWSAVDHTVPKLLKLLPYQTLARAVTSSHFDGSMSGLLHKTRVLVVLVPCIFDVLFSHPN